MHIEIAPGLDTNAFLNALRRFIGRCSNPAHIYSNNDTNFVGAERVLRESLQDLDQHRINDYLSQHKINWHFNPPAGSHFNGASERMIRSVRRIFSIIFKDQVLTDDTLHTIMVEIEAILNFRPLVPIVFDPEDSEPLTPNHLLLLRGIVPIPPFRTKRTVMLVVALHKSSSYQINSGGDGFANICPMCRNVKGGIKLTEIYSATTLYSSLTTPYLDASGVLEES